MKQLNKNIWCLRIWKCKDWVGCESRLDVFAPRLFADEEVLRRRSIFQEDLDSPSDSSLLLLRRRRSSVRKRRMMQSFFQEETFQFNWSNTGVSGMISLICRRVNLIINNLGTLIASPQVKPYLKNLLGEVFQSLVYQIWQMGGFKLLPLS